MDEQKQKAIEHHNADLVNSMDPLAVTDNMSAGLLSLMEREFIKESLQTRRDRNRELIFILFRKRDELKPFERFVEALKKTDASHKIMAKDILKTYRHYSDATDFERVSRRSPSDAEKTEYGLQTVQKSLKDMYLQRFRKTNPFSLPFTFDIENTWVSLELKEYTETDEDTDEKNVEEENKINSKHSGGTQNCTELLKNAFAKEKMLIIEGKPARGKTSLMRRLAYEWAKGKQELSHFDLIIYAEFREVREQIFERITDLVFEYTKSYIEYEELTNLKSLLSNRNCCKQRKFLLLLDGYDESSLDEQCKELTAYLTSSIINKPLVFNIVLTTRPGYLSKFHGQQGRFVFAKVLGFTTTEQKWKYISNHFSSHKKADEKIEAVHSLLINNENLKKLAKTPLFLTFICLVHERIVDGTLVELYCNIIWWLIDRHQKHNLDRNVPALFGFFNGSGDKFETIQDHYLHFPQLHCLGSMALHNLHENEFKSSDYAQFKLQPIIEQVGLLRKEKKRDIFKLVTSFFFPHRTIQEFLAAFYCFCSNNPTSEWLLPSSYLDTSTMNEFNRFLFRIALSINMPIQAEKHKNFFEKINEINVDTTFDAFNVTAGFNNELLNRFLSQCTNIEYIQLNGELNSARHELNMVNDTSVHKKPTVTSKMCNPKLFSFRDLCKLHSLTIAKCTFEANSQLYITNCPSLNKLKFNQCNMKCSTNLGIATLLALDTMRFSKCTFEVNAQLSFPNFPALRSLEFWECNIASSKSLGIETLTAIDSVELHECTFEANSQLSFTNCPSLKNLKFNGCKMRSSTSLGIATLPAIHKVEFSECIFEASYQLLFRHCSSLEIWKFLEYSTPSSTNLGIAALPEIETLLFDKCAFEANSQLLLTKCPSFKNLKFNGCIIERSTNFSNAALPATETMQFDQCKIDLAAWQSITEQIRSNSIKYLKLTFGKDFNKEFLIHLQKCNNVENMEIEIKNYIIRQNDQLSFNDLIKLRSLIIDECTFSANCQLSFTNCPSLKNLKFNGCEIKSSTIVGIATLPAIDTLRFKGCTFEATCQLSFTNCPSLKNLEFSGCEIKSSTIVSIATLPAIDTLRFKGCTFEATCQLSFRNCSSLKSLEFSNCKMMGNTFSGLATLPAIDTVEFWQCNINLAAWQSITDQIGSSSVKHLKLSFEWVGLKLLLNHMQKCNNVEKMDITITGHFDKYCVGPFFTDLMKLQSLTFKKCEFQEDFQPIFKNCPFLKKLTFSECELRSESMVDIRTLPAIDTVEFYQCKIDLASWESITDAIRNSSVTCLQLSADYFVKETYSEFLHHLQKCERIQQITVQDVTANFGLELASILIFYKEKVFANFAQTVQKLPRLRSITLLDSNGRAL